MKDLAKVFVESSSELRTWLENNYQQTESVWLVKWKKTVNKPFLPYDEIVDELLCFGWIDSLARKLDDQRTMLLISSRNSKSNWSGSNKERVARLIKDGRMAAPGLALINTAKGNGAWEFLDDVERLIIPQDLQLALNSTPQAAYYFQRFPDSSKRGILEWIKNARRDETRNKRIEETATKAALNIKANHPKGRNAGPKDDAA